MTRAALAVVAFTLLTLFARVARADWNAVIECKTGKTLIRDARWVTLTKPLACSVRVLSRDDSEGVAAELEIAHDRDSFISTGALRTEGTRKPVSYFRFEQQPRRGYDFKGCAPFILRARITRHGVTIWGDELQIFARCGTPKKLKPRFRCTTEGCTLSVDAKQVRPGERLFAYLTVGESFKRYEMIEGDGGFSLGGRVYVSGISPCQPTEVKGEILDGDDQSRWAGKTFVDVECFERGEP